MLHNENRNDLLEYTDMQILISITQNTLNSKGDNGSYKYFVFEAGCFSPLNLFDKIFFITINMPGNPPVLTKNQSSYFEKVLSCTL